jgi:hypothetical protein
LHRDSQRALKETKRQLDKKRAEYEQLRRGEARLTTFTGKLGLSPEWMEARISELEAAEEAGAFTRPPGSGGGGRECRAGA